MKERGITIRIDSVRNELPIQKNVTHKVYAIESTKRRVTERIYRRRFSAEGEMLGRSLVNKLKAGEAFDPESTLYDGEALGFVIQEIGGNIPAPLVPPNMLETPSAVLNGNSLQKLYDYAKRRPDRHGESPIAYVRRRAGLELTTEDIIGGIDIGIKLRWRRISQTIKNDLLERAATEQGKPAKIFDVPDFEYNYDFLNGRNLMTMLQQAKTDPQRNGMDIIPYILENAGITRYETHEMIGCLQSRGNIRWAQVPEKTALDLLKIGAIERELKPYEMGYQELNTKFNFLRGATLDKYYQYMQRHPQRGDKPIMDFIHEKLGMVDVLIDEIKSGQQVDWSKVPNYLIRKVLEKAARKKPIYALREKDFKTNYAFLNNHNLESLYEYAENHPEKGTRDTIDYLFEKIDMVEEVVADIIKDSRIRWSLVPQSLIRGLITKAAADLPIPVPASLVNFNELATSNYAFIKGKTLRGLTDFLIREKNNRQEVTSMTRFMLNYADIPPATVDEVVQFLKTEKQLQWENVTNSTFRGVFTRAAEELGKRAYTLKLIDLKTPLDLLGGKSLSRVISHVYRDDEIETQGFIPLLFEKFDMQMALIKDIKEQKKVPWADVPPMMVKQLLDEAADELDIQTKQLQDWSLIHVNFDFLNKNTLEDLSAYLQAIPHPEQLTPLHAVYKMGGYKAETQEEVIDLYANGVEVRRAELTPEIIRNLFLHMQFKADKTRNFFSLVDFRYRKYAFINNHSLAPLYDAFVQKGGNMTESALSRLKKVISASHNTATFAKQRKQLINESYLDVFNFQSLHQQTSAIDIEVYTQRVVREYRPYFAYLGVSEEDLRTRIFMKMFSLLQSGKTFKANDAMNYTFSLIESMIATEKATFYKTKTKRMPLKGSTETIGDAIKVRISADGQKAKPVFNAKLYNTLKDLSPLQRVMIFGICAGDQTFESLAPIVNRFFTIDITPETLQELYEDSLVLLNRNAYDLAA